MLFRSGEIDEERDTGEILEDDAGDDEGDFVFAGGFCIVGGEVFDVIFGDFFSIAIPDEGF